MNNNSNKNNLLQYIIKKHGVSLNQIEKININQKEYMKFNDPKENQVIMYEVRNDGLNINSLEKIEFVSIADIYNNYTQYEQLFRLMPSKDRYSVLNLIKNQKNFNIEKIGLKNNIALNKYNQVISCSYNPHSEKYELVVATVSKYEQDKEPLIKFDETHKLENISNESIERYTSQVKLNNKFYDLEQLSNYPEILDWILKNGEINVIQYKKVQEMISDYITSKEQSSSSNSNSRKKQKSFTKSGLPANIIDPEYQREAGFVNVIFLITLVCLLISVILFILIGQM